MREGAKKREQEKFESKKLQFERFTGIGTLIIACASIFTTIFTYTQITESNKTNKETLNKIDSATYIENRAFIQLQGGVQETFTIDTKSLTITDVFGNMKNTGKTPAYNIDMKYNATVDSSHFDTTKFKHGMNVSIMGTEQAYEPSIRVDSVPIVDFFLTKQHFFIYGKITYIDFFRRKHFLNFYFKVIPTRFNSNPIPNIDALMKSILNKETAIRFIAMNKYNDGD